MINRPYLTYLMQANGDNVASLAAALNMAKSSLYERLNDDCAIEFKLSELQQIASRYNLTSDDVFKAFFTTINKEKRNA